MGLDDDLAVERFIDGANWESKLEKRRATLAEHSVSVGVLIHPGGQARGAGKSKGRQFSFSFYCCA